MRIPLQVLFLLGIIAAGCANIDFALAQSVTYPPSSGGLRPIESNPIPTTTAPYIVPINPATQAGVYPSNGYGSPTFDPFASSQSAFQPGVASNPYPPPLGGYAAPSPFGSTAPVYPPNYGTPDYGAPGYGAPGYGAPTYGAPTYGAPTYGAPTYGTSPGAQGAAPSSATGGLPPSTSTFNQPGIYPNSSPSALFPSTTGFGYPGPTSAFGAPAASNSYWNPQGTMFTTGPSTPDFVRLCQGPRFRHAYIAGNDSSDALSINDSDFSLAFLFPNFFFSNQPLYLLPSFSLHQWAGPKPQPSSSPDLPPLAYSAFLDAGWQTDPARIFGADLGLRVGMFTDFDTANSDSLRVLGRAIGRLRLTPTATAKLGVLYLDRNEVKLLPAGGLLCQPTPNSRLDIFFPEPKLSHSLSTIGTTDTWWYLGGYYGGGSWTVQREDSSSDSIDINDWRVVLGLEWGRSNQISEGRRIGFFEVGYVFNRDLVYRHTPADNLSLQDTFMLRAGFGY